MSFFKQKPCCIKINNIDYYVPETLLKDSAIMGVINSGKWKKDENLELKDYNDKLLNNKTIELFLEYIANYILNVENKTIMNEINNVIMCSFRNLLNMLIIFDFLGMESQVKIFKTYISTYLEQFGNNKLCETKLTTHINNLILTLLSDVESGLRTVITNEYGYDFSVYEKFVDMLHILKKYYPNIFDKFISSSKNKNAMTTLINAGTKADKYTAENNLRKCVRDLYCSYQIDIISQVIKKTFTKYEDIDKNIFTAIQIDNNFNSETYNILTIKEFAILQDIFPDHRKILLKLVKPYDDIKSEFKNVKISRYDSITLIKNNALKILCQYEKEEIESDVELNKKTEEPDN